MIARDDQRISCTKFTQGHCIRPVRLRRTLLNGQGKRNELWVNCTLHFCGMSFSCFSYFILLSITLHTIRSSVGRPKKPKLGTKSMEHGVRSTLVGNQHVYPPCFIQLLSHLRWGEKPNPTSDTRGAHLGSFQVQAPTERNGVAPLRKRPVDCYALEIRRIRR